MNDIIAVEFERLRDIDQACERNLSLQTSFSRFSNKHILLSAASYLEHCFVQMLEEHTTDVLKGNGMFANFYIDRAIRKSFYKYFEFPKNNVKPFFKSFDKDTWKEKVDAIVPDKVFAEQKQGFCSLINYRNELVHNNYAAYSLELTADEIYSLYVRAQGFIFTVDQFLNMIKSANQLAQLSKRENKF